MTSIEILVFLSLSILLVLIAARLFVPLGMSEPGTGYRKARAKELKREARKLHLMPYQ